MLESTSKLMTDLTQFNFLRHTWRLAEKLIAQKSIPLAYYKDAHHLMAQATESKGHFLHIREAPYYLIVADRFRTPQMANFLIRQSLAHCLQNMFLMATANGMPFQPVSATKFLAADQEVCRMLDIKPKQYELDGCLIGYPTKTITPKSKQIILVLCPKCQGQMKILSFIEVQSVIRQILQHPGLWKIRDTGHP